MLTFFEPMADFFRFLVGLVLFILVVPPACYWSFYLCGELHKRILVVNNERYALQKARRREQLQEDYTEHTRR